MSQVGQAGTEAETLGVEVWRGAVNTWECDQMGHMNVRFYVVRAMEGLAGLAACIGLPHAFSPAANATVMLREQHIRFLREAHAVTPLHMRGCVLEMGEADAQILLVLFHSLTGEPAASFRMRVAHVTPDTDSRAFAWPPHVLEKAARLTAPLPAFAEPRSIDLAPLESQASLAKAQALGMSPIAMGAFNGQDCDVFGRMRAELFIGRVSDGVPAIVGPSQALIAEHLDPRPARIGGAVLEYRMLHLDWPRAGDRFALYSGMAGATSRTHKLVHWMVDPDSGKAWGSSLAINASLDLDARKLIPVPPLAEAELNRRAIPGVGL